MVLSTKCSVMRKEQGFISWKQNSNEIPLEWTTTAEVELWSLILASLSQYSVKSPNDNINIIQKLKRILQIRHLT